MADGGHFVGVVDWAEAESRLGFRPLRPEADPTLIRIHVRDHKSREVEPTLEAQFGNYVLSQARRDPSEARRLAHDERYGLDPREIEIAGIDGVAYELGPVPDPDDIDPRPPAVVTWADDDVFVLLASDSMTASQLIEEARSLYPATHDRDGPVDDRKRH